MSLSEVAASSPWIKALPLREQKGLALYEQICSDNGKAIHTLETSQTIPRMTCTVCTTAKTTSTFLPQGRQIVYPPTVDVPRPMLDIEVLHLMGVPIALIKDFLLKNPAADDGLLHDLGGNTFPGPVIFAMLMSILYNLQPCHMKDEPIVDESAFDDNASDVCDQLFMA